MSTFLAACKKSNGEGKKLRRNHSTCLGGGGLLHLPPGRLSCRRLREFWRTQLNGEVLLLVPLAVPSGFEARSEFLNFAQLDRAAADRDLGNFVTLRGPGLTRRLILGGVSCRHTSWTGRGASSGFELEVGGVQLRLSVRSARLGSSCSFCVGSGSINHKNVEEQHGLPPTSGRWGMPCLTVNCASC
jgi:hypothetical protein